MGEMAAGHLSHSAPTSCNGWCVESVAKKHQLRADCFDWLRKRWAGDVGLVGLTLQSFADHCWCYFMSNKDTKKHPQTSRNNRKSNKIKYLKYILNIFWTYFVQRFLLNVGLSSALGEAGLPSFWGESRGHRSMDAHGWTKERNAERSSHSIDFFLCKKKGMQKEWKEKEGWMMLMWHFWKQFFWANLLGDAIAWHGGKLRGPGLESMFGNQDPSWPRNRTAWCAGAVTIRKGWNGWERVHVEQAILKGCKVH